MIRHLHFARGGRRSGPPAQECTPADGRSAVASPARAPEAVDPGIALPPEAEALVAPSHFWAGFRLRGVQS